MSEALLVCREGKLGEHSFLSKLTAENREGTMIVSKEGMAGNLVWGTSPFHLLLFNGNSHPLLLIQTISKISFV